MRAMLKKVFPVFLLSLIVWGVHANSLKGSFVWDDKEFVLFNRIYQEFDLHGIFISLANGLEYLPVRDLSFAIDFALWGFNPVGFHITNLVIYWLTVVIIYCISVRLTLLIGSSGEGCTSGDATLIAFMTAALFAVHPIHSEVVSFINCRNTLLAGLFFFLALWCYLKYLLGESKSRIWYAAAFFAFVLSILAKATGIILPFILLLCSTFTCRKNLRACLQPTLPFFFVSLAAFFLFKYIALQTNIIDQELLTYDSNALLGKAAVALKIPLFYLSKLLVPVALTPEYEINFDMSFFSFLSLASLCTLAALVAVAIWQRKRYPLLYFCLAWYLLTLVPVLNIFPTYPVVADRYAYLPSFALFFLIASASNALLRHRRNWLYGGVVLLLIGLGVLAWKQNRIWKDEKSLWEHALIVSPRTVKANINLGTIYFNAGNYRKAFALFRKAQEINPANPMYDLALGMRHFALVDYGNAIIAFNQALSRDSQHIVALYQLGKSYEKLGNREAAISSYMKVLQSTAIDIGNHKAQARKDLERLGAM